MSGGAGPRPLATALIAAVVATSIAAWIATADPALALAPVALAVLGWALVTAPPHRIALAVFFLAILADNPKEHPAEGKWISPIQPLGRLLYENLNNLTGVSALRFSGADLLLAALVVLVALRERRRDAIPAPPALHRVLGAAWIAVVWLEVWGLARGGDFKASLWQARPLFWAPVIAWLFAALLRGSRDHEAIGKAVVAAAIVKAALGAYFYLVVCRPLGYRPAYATTHSDTVLFVAAAAIALASWIERRTRPAAKTALAILALVGLGIVVNGRRLAYVSLAGSLVAIYFVLPPERLRKVVDRALVWASPAALLYLAVGWSSSSAVFGPARKIASLFSKTDRSSAMRDIENYNLILTWKRGLVLGSGFGHEYDEISKADNIKEIFQLYRYIGHNSVLWLASVGGVVGLAAFWMLLVALAYYAARSYRFAAAPVDRAAALAALSVVVIFGVQAYGDMGLNSWTAVFFLGMSLAVAGKLAVASGAVPWPRDAAARAFPLPSPSPGR